MSSPVQDFADLKLTEWTSCGGCAAKWGASLLTSLVRDLPGGVDPSLLVGLAPFGQRMVTLVGIYAELLVKDWRGITGRGVPIPYSVEAGKAFLLAADDAYAAVDAIVFDNKNFRAQRVEAIVDEVKN